MVTDTKSEDLSLVFRCPVMRDVLSSSLRGSVDDHIVPYFLPQMRLAVYVHEMPSYHLEGQMLDAGYYVLVVPRDRVEARNAMKYFAHTVYWTSDGDAGHGVYNLSEPQLFGDVGHDLLAVKDVTIPAKNFALVDSNVRLQMPPTVYGWITARSSTARKLLMIPNGILDAGYRGPLFAQVLNMTDEEVTIEKGDRVAQVIFQPRLPVNISYVDSFWMPTERNENGFGSTGR
jgi:dUTP pyrophosphatase